MTKPVEAKREESVLATRLCIVHLVQPASKYVADADCREIIRDLRNIHQAATVLEAEQGLKTFGERWDTKYPTISKLWTAKWSHIISMFDLLAVIRNAVCQLGVADTRMISGSG